MIAVFTEREICTQLAGRDRFHEEIHFLSGKLDYTPSGSNVERTWPLATTDLSLTEARGKGNSQIWNSVALSL